MYYHSHPPIRNPQIPIGLSQQEPGRPTRRLSALPTTKPTLSNLILVSIRLGGRGGAPETAGYTRTFAHPYDGSSSEMSTLIQASNFSIYIVTLTITLLAYFIIHPINRTKVSHRLDQDVLPDPLSSSELELLDNLERIVSNKGTAMVQPEAGDNENSADEDEEDKEPESTPQEGMDLCQKLEKLCLQYADIDGFDVNVVPTSREPLRICKGFPAYNISSFVVSAAAKFQQSHEVIIPFSKVAVVKVLVNMGAERAGG
ncbi:hypothetical protein K503DRAFT_784486 [Rhizopogon vinicolor AM-OR11-026]|uniref:Uncharacterized protein n=1 Tax=Rhizopogon vinicolor AM-OR11-026 TaxID=1314800 RepID=A0A1B7MUK5_9AGAM|nr:hypothetical protein K503DRAFT_784486 [Rhizopogon vinicolor AM-OR11-026]